MSSDSKVDARHADGDDGFENLPADDEKKDEEELKEPAPYNERGLPLPAGVSYLFWSQLLLIGIILLSLYSLYIVASTRATDKTFQYHLVGLLVNVVMALFGWVLLLSIMSFAAVDHNTVLETLHAHRMETYRLHKELRATRAKKYKNE
jgi:hypothetical protein